GAAIFPESVDTVPVPCGSFIIVVRDDVGLCQLVRIQPGELSIPNAGRQRLVRVDLAAPGKDLFQQRKTGRTVPGIARLVVEIPQQDPAVMAEMGKYVLYIGLERIHQAGLFCIQNPRIAYPAGIVDAGSWRRLEARVVPGIPAIIEENEDGADVVTVGDVEIPADAQAEPCRILLPRQVMKEDAHAIEADGFGISQFPVDGCRVECLLLPHLQLVDRSAGYKIGAA